jgi:hypothetical protein
MKRRILSFALVLAVLAATVVLAARRPDVPVVVDVRGNVTPRNAAALETALQTEVHTTRPMRMVVTISDRVVEASR